MPPTKGVKILSWIKQIFIIFFFVSIIVFIELVATKHQSNITTTQDVEFALSTVNVGEARESLEGNMTKDAIVSNLLLKIADAHKDHKYETVIDYVFLDENGNVTNDEDKIKSVQFEVKLLNKKGQVESISKERIEINSLIGGEH